MDKIEAENARRQDEAFKRRLTKLKDLKGCTHYFKKPSKRIESKNNCLTTNHKMPWIFPKE